jgi:hypothetical protein
MSSLKNKADPALFAYVKGIQSFGRHDATMIPQVSITDTSGLKNYGVLLKEYVLTLRADVQSTQGRGRQ